MSVGQHLQVSIFTVEFQESRIRRDHYGIFERGSVGMLYSFFPHRYHPAMGWSAISFLEEPHCIRSGVIAHLEVSLRCHAATRGPI